MRQPHVSNSPHAKHKAGRTYLIGPPKNVNEAGGLDNSTTSTSLSVANEKPQSVVGGVAW